MRKIRLFAFLLVLLVTCPMLGQDVSIESFELEEKEGALTLKSFLLPKGTFFGDIRVPTEGLFLSVEPPQDDIVREADFLGTGLSFDLNADGDQTDLFRLIEKEDRLFVETLEVKPFGRDHNTQDTGSAQIYRLVDEGPGMVLYSVYPRINLGLDHHGHKAGFVTLPNPFLQVLLVEPCEGPTGAPDLTLEGAKGYAYTFEPGITGPEPSWARVQWLACPPGEPRRYRITGKGAGFLLGIVNTSTEPGVRVRGERVIKEIKLP